MTRMLRWTVPVDGDVHQLTMPLASHVRHVAARAADSVDLWVSEHEESKHGPRWFVVTGTGEHAPVGAWWVGTALSPAITDTARHLPAGALVWHLWELAFEPGGTVRG